MGQELFKQINKVIHEYSYTNQGGTSVVVLSP